MFVCIGNTCRSPMAEGFANHYGSDVLVARSSGLAPVKGVAEFTVRAMEEKNVDVSRHIPQLYDPREAAEYDLVVNLSGFRLPGVKPKNLREWKVVDPYGDTLEVYCQVRDDIENLVMRLILELRRDAGRAQHSRPARP